MMSIGNIRLSLYLYAKVAIVIDFIDPKNFDNDISDVEMILFFTDEGMTVCSNIDGVDAV